MGSFRGNRSTFDGCGGSRRITFYYKYKHTVFILRSVLPYRPESLAACLGYRRIEPVDGVMQR